MKLWLLKRPPEEVSYDEADGFVVRAATAEEARQIAAQGAGDEGASEWLDPGVACVEVEADGAPGLVLRSFVNG